MSHHNRKKAMGQALLLVSWTARAQTLTLRELEGLTLCFSLQGGGWPSIALQGEALLQHPEEACCNELVCSARLEKIQMWPPTLRNKAFTLLSVCFHCITVQWQQRHQIKLTSASHANVTGEFLGLQSEGAVSAQRTSRWLNVMSRLPPVLSQFPVYMHYWWRLVSHARQCLLPVLTCSFEATHCLWTKPRRSFKSSRLFLVYSCARMCTRKKTEG